MNHIGTKTIRDVGGELLSKTVVEAGCARIETIQRKITGDMAGIFASRSRCCFGIGAGPRGG